MSLIKGKIRLRNFWISSFAVFLFIGLLALWIFVLGLKADEPGRFYNSEKNAIWIAHEWAEESKTDREISDLVRNLTEHDINTIYLHVGPIESDGEIGTERYAASLNFVERVKRQRADMKVLAWMGQVRHKLDLSNENVRRNILGLCRIFTKMIGMDGIHYDIEPVWDEDEDFILLLKETRDILDTGTGVSYGSEAGSGSGEGGRKILSVALAEFIPSSFVWWVGNIAQFENYNTEVNYLNVAEYADQIVDMVYDTGIDRGWLYKWLVKEQVIWVSDLMEDDVAEGTEFLIGIPSYEDDKIGFNPEVENVGNALVGVITGLNDIRASEEAFTGVAIYSEWEMDEGDWEVYEGLWQ
jgi:hypothetical protein